MSRSIGDFVATSLGVVPEPVIIESAINSHVKYIVLASDGVWEFLDNDKVKQIVDKYYAKNDPKGACEELVKRSAEIWATEDTCCDDM